MCLHSSFLFAWGSPSLSVFIRELPVCIRYSILVYVYTRASCLMVLHDCLCLHASFLFEWGRRDQNCATGRPDIAWHGKVTTPSENSRHCACSKLYLRQTSLSVYLIHSFIESCLHAVGMILNLRITEKCSEICSHRLSKNLVS